MQTDTWIFPTFCDIRQKIYGPKVFLLTKIKPEYSDILFKLTHFPGSLVCQIRQVLTSCTIWHISLVPWCVRLDRFHCTYFVYSPPYKFWTQIHELNRNFAEILKLWTSHLKKIVRFKFNIVQKFRTFLHHFEDRVHVLCNELLIHFSTLTLDTL